MEKINKSPDIPVDNIETKKTEESVVIEEENKEEAGFSQALDIGKVETIDDDLSEASTQNRDKTH